MIEKPPVSRFRLNVAVVIEAVSLHAAETVLAEIMDAAEDQTQGYQYLAGIEEVDRSLWTEADIRRVEGMTPRSDPRKEEGLA